MSRFLLDIRGIGKNNIIFFPHREKAKIGPDNFDAVFTVVEPDIALGQVRQRSLDLKSSQVRKWLDAQEER